MSQINILKRNGVLEPLDISKITKALEWASEGLNKVSISQIEVNANLHFYDGMPSAEIHDILIKTAKNMTDLRNVEYDKVASHLLIQKIYKDVFAGMKRYNLFKIFDKVDRYNNEIIEAYTEKEVNLLDKYIDNSRDFNFTLAGLEQLIDKYMIISEKGEIQESPQLMFMAIAMDAFKDFKGHNGKTRLDMVKDLYDALSTFSISLPTPMMKALRTKNNDYASCIIIKIGDSIDSWTTGKSAIVEHTVASAGIGVDVSSVSSLGDMVKEGQIVHGGKIPLLKAIDADIQLSTQNGRRGQAVAYVNFFDPEIEVIMSLKSPRTETAKRINDLKYGIKLNQVWYERVKEGKDIPLFSVRKYPKLKELFESKDIDKFRRLYNKLEKEGKASGYINAREYGSLFVTERTENGVYYPFNIDEANNSSTFKESVTQSNICMEYISPSRDISSRKPNSPDVGVCILSNINQGIVSEDRLSHYTNLLVFMLNEIKDRQTHPTSQANAHVRHYATLGIGFANHAYFLAKNHCRYGSEEGLKLHDRWMEHFQFNLIKASVEYTKYSGVSASKFNKTVWADGIMPQDRYKKTVDELVQRDLELDWDSLREEVMEYGMYNCTLSMIPPSETSSVIGGMTSSLEPIKDLITIKSTKGVNLAQLAPEALKLADKYDFAFDRKNMTTDFIKHLAVTQKWVCMGISGNTFYNPELYEDEKIPEKQVLSDLFLAKYYGMKTLYYSNVYVEDEELKQEDCQGGGCAV